jgi:hypothetical protein
MDWRHGAFLRSVFLRAPHSKSRGSLVMLQSAREQFTAPLEDRIGGRCQMSVDPLEVAHDVEQELAHLNVLCPTDTRWSEIFFGRARFNLPEDFLFAEELASCPQVLGHEHGHIRLKNILASLNEVLGKVALAPVIEDIQERAERRKLLKLDQ